MKLSREVNEIPEHISNMYSRQKKIKNNYPNAQVYPPCLLGASGIGKTVAMQSAAEKICEENDYELINFADFNKMSSEEKENYLNELEKEPFFFVDLNLLIHEPMDFSGKPTDGEVTFSHKNNQTHKVTNFQPMSWVPYLQEHPGLLFIDEINNINRDDLRAIAYKVVGERKIGYSHLHDNTFIALAGNRVEDSSVAHELPAPLANRMQFVNVAPPSASEWMKYVQHKYDDNLDSGAVGYLAYVASNHAESPEGDILEQFPTPRSCEALVINATMIRESFHNSEISQEKFQSDVEIESVETVGYSEGQLFAEWFKQNMDIMSAMKTGDSSEISQMSTCSLWGLSSIVGGNLPDNKKQYDQMMENSETGEILKNMGKTTDAILSNGMEYATPVIISANMFSQEKENADIDRLKNSMGKLQFLVELTQGKSPDKAKENLEAYDNIKTSEIYVALNGPDGNGENISSKIRKGLKNPFFKAKNDKKSIKALKSASNMLVRNFSKDKIAEDIFQHEQDFGSKVVEKNTEIFKETNHPEHVASSLQKSEK